jgi:hypothetical protein
MNHRYQIKTIRSEQVLGTYLDEQTANTALENFAEQYREDGLFLIRFRPVVIKSITPKKALA